ncbi:MAG: hypothetical protein JWP58_1090 [Hymenobacter sp.]|nr:hypothetical protein [Hymenobacter sp.]
METTNQLPAEVAAHYELTTHSTRMYVPRLGREVDLTKLTLAEAAELVALPGGFEWLRVVPAPEPAALVDASPTTSVGPAADTAGPTRAKRKTGARREA